MKILVCVKEVHDPESPVFINYSGLIDESQNITFRMNRYDEFALEEAVRIKEAFPQTTVHALSLGPERVKNTLKKALEKGADDAFHIKLEEESFIAPEITAAAISRFISEQEYDIILTGVMAEDDMQSIVGPLIAARLNLPCAVSVIEEKIGPEKNSITVQCETGGGRTEEARLRLPCVLAVQSGINRPRYPSLSNVMRAKTQELSEVRFSDSGIPDNPYKSVVLNYPEKSSTGIILEGSREEKADKLIDILHEKGLL